MQSRGGAKGGLALTEGPTVRKPLTVATRCIASPQSGDFAGPESSPAQSRYYKGSRWFAAVVNAVNNVVGVQRGSP